jgi:hypothetical protein
MRVWDCCNCSTALLPLGVSADRFSSLVEEMLCSGKFSTETKTVGCEGGRKERLACVEAVTSANEDTTLRSFRVWLESRRLVFER